MESNGKFCPHCKLLNISDAIICEHCGKPIASGSYVYSKSADVRGKTKYFPSILDSKKERVSKDAPAEGIAIYSYELTEPIEICLVDEFVIGRLTEETEEKVADLTPYNALDLGVSRRHLMIRREGQGYSATDLGSSNGTWVDEQRLLPFRSSPLNNGSQIRLGRMQLFVIFQQ